ncbi:hypothetical protein VCRA2119O48_230061 [Vibrio crassostreae]|nr:hypothetical protein VCRA2119O48_230061 [Vibrio crassostreae]CAK3388722.1 hypothetical protein VCRA2122O339_250017 [Vibrio crassostreae]CAK3412926.1 hypothetical protein VCRA2122O338_260071 [Vibrio crassostreae]CAK3816749.1 hypothetical protein VCRA2121O335_260017 [Vibrio crassostreae]CAK3818045.1 hypothetical protein VCRA2121O337_260018 [Vibrio crassostreae]
MIFIECDDIIVKYRPALNECDVYLIFKERLGCLFMTMYIC